MKSAHDKIMAGIQSAKAFKTGDMTRGRIAEPSEQVNAKVVRERTGLSQRKFADTYRLPVATVQDWEQRRRAPDTGSSVYLKMIAADPDGVRDILAKV